LNRRTKFISEDLKLFISINYKDFMTTAYKDIAAHLLNRSVL